MIVNMHACTSDVMQAVRDTSRGALLSARNTAICTGQFSFIVALATLGGGVYLTIASASTLSDFRGDVWLYGFDLYLVVIWLANRCAA